MKVVPLIFINRFSRLKSWPENPVSFRDVVVANSVTDLEFLNKNIYSVISKSHEVASYSLPQFIEVFEIKQESMSTWNMRALIVKPVDHNLSFLDLQRKLSISLMDLDSCHDLKSIHDRDTNDLRNTIWATEFDNCFVFLTYNKNAVRRLQNHFPVLADQHLLECKSLWKEQQV
jgi:hypothetical protein